MFKTRKDFKVGDIAIVLMTDIRREKWQRGRILEIYPGKDGHVNELMNLLDPFQNCALECERDIEN